MGLATRPLTREETLHEVQNFGPVVAQCGAGCTRDFAIASSNRKAVNPKLAVQDFKEQAAYQGPEPLYRDFTAAANDTNLDQNIQAALANSPRADVVAPTGNRYEDAIANKPNPYKQGRTPGLPTPKPY